MPLTIEDLNGKYRVTTVSDYNGPVPMKSDGITEIKDGRTHRTDANGVEWTTQFTVASDTEVTMTSTADPKGARAEFLLTKENGELTNDPVTYTTALKVSRKGDEIRLSGTIQHGKVSTILNMMKIVSA
jgi:hypothetical protein